MDEDLERLRAQRMRELLTAAPAAAPEAAEGVVPLSDATFDAFLGQHPVTLVDFWAPWCGPCRAVAPIVEEVARRWASRAAVGKVNTDENPGVAGRFGIRSIPTLIAFKDGRPHTRLVGLRPMADLDAALRHASGATRLPDRRRL